MLQNVTNSSNSIVDPRMIIAAELLANPDFSGTKEDVAREAGVTRQTLYRWLRNPDFVELVNSLVTQYANAELAMVWKSLCKRIQDGDTRAIKLYFDLRERGLTMKQQAEEQDKKTTSRLYETLGADDGTDYKTITEAETGDEMGTHGAVSE